MERGLVPASAFLTGLSFKAWRIQNGFAFNWTRFGGPFEHLQEEAAAR
jgi:hypothetical protein